MTPAKFKRLQTARHWVQLLFFAAIILIPILNSFDITILLGTLYSLSIGPLDIIDPAMALQSLILGKYFYLPMMVALLIPVGVAIAMGRVFCSWVCPYNTVLEWIDSLQNRLFPKKWAKSHAHGLHGNPDRRWYWGILGLIALLTLVLNFPLFTHLSFPGIISKQIATIIRFGEVQVILLLVFVVLTVEVLLFRRFWCKYVCPVGACYGVFKNRKSLEIKYDKDTCICQAGEVKPCHTACPLHLAPTEEGVYPYCFNCGRCVEACEKSHENAGLRNFGWKSKE